MHRTEQKKLMAQVRTLSIKNKIKLLFLCVFFFIFISFVFILFVGAFVL